MRSNTTAVRASIALIASRLEIRRVESISPNLTCVEAPGRSDEKRSARRNRDNGLNKNNLSSYSFGLVASAEGVEFIDEKGGGAGVRLRKPNTKGSKKTGGV